MTILWILISVVAAVLLLGALTFNLLVRRRNRMEKLWIRIDGELRHRRQVVTDLTIRVGGQLLAGGSYAEVAEACAAETRAVSTGDPARVAAAESRLAGSLRMMFARSEGTQGFEAAKQEVAGLQSAIEAERGRFNAATRSYNNLVRLFPSAIIARAFGFAVVPQFGSVSELLWADPSTAQQVDQSEPVTSVAS